MQKQLNLRQQQKALKTFGELEILATYQAWITLSNQRCFIMKEYKLKDPEIGAIKENVNLTISKNHNSESNLKQSAVEHQPLLVATVGLQHPDDVELSQS